MSMFSHCILGVNHVHPGLNVILTVCEMSESDGGGVDGGGDNGGGDNGDGVNGGGVNGGGVNGGGDNGGIKGGGILGGGGDGCTVSTTLFEHISIGDTYSYKGYWFVDNELYWFIHNV